MMDKQIDPIGGKLRIKHSNTIDLNHTFILLLFPKYKKYILQSLSR